MARKRIKTLASEWGVSVEEVLASCVRLRLPHAHSESSLLSQDETDRVKADLDEQVHRDALLRRETVVETSAGTVVEKRLNATVMRRRHAESSPAPAAPPAEPFHFDTSEADDVSFVAPLFDTPVAVEPVLQEFSIPEPPQMEPEEAEPQPGPTSSEAIAQPIEESASPVTEPVAIDPETVAAPNGAHSVAASPSESAAPASKAAPETERPAAQAANPPKPAPQTPIRPVVVERTTVEQRRTGAPSVAPPRRVEQRPGEGPARTINLTRAEHAGAPALDDGPRGPKVLGKIDLRKPTPPPRPAAPTGVRAPTPARPAERRFNAPSSAPMPQNFGPPPPDGVAKPGARLIKKKKVVKKGTTDSTAEREMRGMRVPAQDRDYDTQGLQARRAHRRGCDRWRPRSQYGRQGHRDNQEADGPRRNVDA
jgi:hypothetical protein